jgi:transposase-like protein
MKEEEIRPKKIFEEYLSLTIKDIETYFTNIELESISCPACNSSGVFSFEKEKFTYYECKKCNSMYVNPRPKSEYFNQYYTDSPSTKYWATTFYKETAAARIEKMWKPKAKIINDKIKKFLDSEDFTLIDIGAGYGLFCDEISKYLKKKPLAIEPSVHLQEVLEKKGYTVIPKFLEEIIKEDLPHSKKCFTSFELFEHLHSPKIFMNNLREIMEAGDYFIFTTLSGTGLDIQVLWENSNSVHPPHHLNFLNPQSVRLLLENLGFEIIEITTPGKLDISIMENKIEFVNDRFWKTFLSVSTEEEKNNMQNYITDNMLSSHMMIVCKKK